MAGYTEDLNNKYAFSYQLVTFGLYDMGSNVLT